MQEDEVLNKITRLLEKGCTMLAAHHDCGAPLFRCQGEIVCPVCSFADDPGLPARAQPSGSSGEEMDARSSPGRARQQETEDIKEEKEGIKYNPDDADLGASQSSRQGGDEMSKALSDLRSALLARLQELTESVRDERDLHMLKRQLDCLEGLLRILRSLQG